MKKLSRDEMKKIMGGDEVSDTIEDVEDEGGESSAGCAATCKKKVGKKTYIGRCKLTKSPKSSIEICVCSQSGGIC